jgi:hypothetical protein
MMIELVDLDGDGTCHEEFCVKFNVTPTDYVVVVASVYDKTTEQYACSVFTNHLFDSLYVVVDMGDAFVFTDEIRSENLVQFLNCEAESVKASIHRLDELNGMTNATHFSISRVYMAQ